MDTTTLLGSRMTQLGFAHEIERVERSQGHRAARRSAAVALFTRVVARREPVAH